MIVSMAIDSEVSGEEKGKSMNELRLKVFLSLWVFFGALPLARAADDPLVEAARREGQVVLYASMNIAEAKTTIDKFEERYPFVKVNLNRSGSEKLLTRVLTEARAQKSMADVIQTVEFSMHVFHRNGLLARYVPPEDGLYPKEFKEEGFWTTVYYNPYVTAYNTNRVAPDKVPKTYEDLLDPKWKGQLMMEGTKADWFAGMLQIMGRERGLRYMRALAAQKPMLREGHALLAQLVAAGEGAMDINIPASSVDRLKDKGAPIEWISLGVAPAIMVGIGLSAEAPHPHAAKLFINFMLSQEAQKLMQSFGRLVARTDLKPEQPGSAREVNFMPVNPALAEKMKEYATLLRAIFGGA